MNKNKEIIFELGDRVFDILFGWGTITYINNIIDDFCIKVTFDSKLKMWYTANGSLNELYTPTLSFTQYTIEGFNQVRTNPPINYQEYIGKWGKFWDTEDNVVIIDTAGRLAVDEEILKIANKELTIPRLELVRDLFLFSCFTGLAYIDVANLRREHLVTMNGKTWIMTRRKKTKVESNILLLDIPKAIIEKYSPSTIPKDGELFPILSNQKMNAYLKEIADVCGLQKRLTFHLARHTFATMSLSKGVPMESVSKMLGHTNIKTTQIYARITSKKIEHDMEQLAGKLDKFNEAMGL